MTRPLRDRVRVYSHFSYSHWGMFRLPIIILPWWHAEIVADDEDIEELEENK